MSFRQTAEISSLKDSAKLYHPGIDFKFKILDETPNLPALSLGFDTAFGDKRTASEYIAVSKRWKNFDFTGGLGWGRLGGEGHFKNPFSIISSHFEKNRSFNSFNTQTTEDWFTGKKIGLFGGVEYFTPIENLSLKADYNGQDYDAEQLFIEDYNEPAPWSVGLNYKALPQLDLSLGILGAEKIMARASIQDNAKNWPVSYESKKRNKKKPYQFIRNDLLDLHSYHSTALQIGDAAQTHYARNGTENISFTLSHKGLIGPSVTLVGNDITNNRSAEEIWRNAHVNKAITGNIFKPQDATITKLKKRDLRFILAADTSLSEPDVGALYRISGLVDATQELPYGFMMGGRARLNIANNLHKLRNFRLRLPNPVRSDIGDFADTRVSIDRLYTSWLRSLTPSTHIGLSAGYLEEMYAGVGGEILYRPFGKTFALGAEAWRVNKRDPFSNLNKTITNESEATAHINLYYELLQNNTTLKLSGGQYLDQDIGGTLDIETKFKNNTRLKGFITVTNKRDFFIFEDPTHLYGGIQLSVPFGNLPFAPVGSEVQISAAPFARDTGQKLDKPFSLYDVTEPLSKRALLRDWHSLTP